MDKTIQQIGQRTQNRAYSQIAKRNADSSSVISRAGSPTRALWCCTQPSHVSNVDDGELQQKAASDASGRTLTSKVVSNFWQYSLLDVGTKMGAIEGMHTLSAFTMLR